MKKLYTLTVERSGAQLKIQVAANDLSHAFERATRFQMLFNSDKVVDFTSENL